MKTTKKFNQFFVWLFGTNIYTYIYNLIESEALLSLSCYRNTTIRALIVLIQMKRLKRLKVRYTNAFENISSAWELLFFGSVDFNSYNRPENMTKSFKICTCTIKSCKRTDDLILCVGETTEIDCICTTTSSFVDWKWSTT